MGKSLATADQAEFTLKSAASIAILCFDRPKPKQSLRLAAGQRFQPADVVRAEKVVRALVVAEMQRQQILQPYLGEVKLEAVFYLPYASKEEAAWAEQGGVIHTASPPDVENLVKLINDAAKGPYGLFLDDCQINVQVLMKAYNYWQGFWVRYTCRDPEHPGQVRKRVAAWRKALQGIEARRQKTRDDAAVRRAAGGGATC
jgi:Holliday junction resolvase RusA-like endonuclease